MSLLGSHWRWILGAVVSLSFSTCFVLMVPWLLAWVINAGLQHGQFGTLLLVTGAILLGSAFRGLFTYGQGYFSQTVANFVASDLRECLYDHLQILGFSFHDEAETGQLMSRLIVDIETIRTFIILGLLRAILACIYLVAIIVILFSFDWRLALITMICAFIILLLAIQFAYRLRPLWLRVQNEVGELSTVMQENLSSRRVVKAFAREEFETARFEEKNRDLRELNMATIRLAAWHQPLMVLVLNIVIVLIVWVGGITVVSNRLSLGVLVAAMQYVLLLGIPVRTFGFMVNWFMRGLSSGTRIFSILDTKPSIIDTPGALTLHQAQGEVHFEHVSFAYSNGCKVLHDININAQPGQTIAILGAPGSGKSTILHLLLRFYDPVDGCILVDGHDVRALTQASLRRNIGLVLQDIFLFNARLRDNIAYGVTHATEEQIIAAAKIACIHDFALDLPEGYDTWVGERGVTLSGGQRQRVAIARTLLLNPRVLILDDSISSVDMETEYLIQQALDAVMQDRTTFVVSSRLHTIKNAHQILILEEGRIVECGTHEELLTRNGPYTRLYELQLCEQEEFETRQFASLSEQK